MIRWAVGFALIVYVVWCVGLLVVLLVLFICGLNDVFVVRCWLFVVSLNLLFWFVLQLFSWVVLFVYIVFDVGLVL